MKIKDLFTPQSATTLADYVDLENASYEDIEVVSFACELDKDNVHIFSNNLIKIKDKIMQCEEFKNVSELTIGESTHMVVEQENEKKIFEAKYVVGDKGVKFFGKCYLISLKKQADGDTCLICGFFEKMEYLPGKFLETDMNGNVYFDWENHFRKVDRYSDLIEGIEIDEDNDDIMKIEERDNKIIARIDPIYVQR